MEFEALLDLGSYPKLGLDVNTTFPSALVVLGVKV